MNWVKILLAGVVSGIVVWLVNFVLHGVIMANTYMKYPVFTQTQANPIWFLVISVLMGFFAAILFAKTHRCWGAGVVSGATFGFWLGLVWFFYVFYNPLVLEGFPYYLAWCWGGINLIGFIVFGAVIGAVYKAPKAG